MKGCQNLTHIFTISASWFHDTLLPCKSWRDPGDSGFMPHDWRTKVKIYWICSLASKWWLRVFSGFPRVWMTGCRGVKSMLQTSCCMLQSLAREPAEIPWTRANHCRSAGREGDPSILVDAGFIKIYTRFLLLLQREARLTTHQLHRKTETQTLLLEQILWPDVRVSLSYNSEDGPWWY